MRELFGGKKWRVVCVLFWITLKAAPVWLVPVATARVIDMGYADSPNLWKFAVYIAIAVFLFLQNVPAAIFYTANLVHLTRGMGRDLRIRICRQLQVL
ncbi:hypothetical protein, partial [Pontiella sp.]|uniref:hypothetical protein n=1 Tax=Pontiella sp. TaxID=2837462 RepID=UPI00356A6F56